MLRFAMELGRRLDEDRCMLTAGSLTYTTLLASVPLLTVALAMATALPVFNRFIVDLQDWVALNFLPDAVGLDVFFDQLGEFAEGAAGVISVGTAIFAATALVLVITVDDAINRIFRVPRKRHLAKRLAIYVAVLILGPLLVGASVSMTSYLVVDSLGALNLGWLTQSVLRFLPFVFTCAALALVYYAVPNRQVSPRHALAGALIAGLAFEAAKRGFAIFITKLPTYAVIYGTFATVLFFLVWIYISWLVLLAGATLTAMLPEYGERRLDAGS
jgi:membrane protein